MLSIQTLINTFQYGAIVLFEAWLEVEYQVIYLKNDNCLDHTDMDQWAKFYVGYSIIQEAKSPNVLNLVYTLAQISYIWIHPHWDGSFNLQFTFLMSAIQFYKQI